MAYIGYRISYYEDANVFRLYWWRASAFVKRNVQLLRHAVRPMPNRGQWHNWTRNSNLMFEFNKLCYNETSEGTWCLCYTGICSLRNKIFRIVLVFSIGQKNCPKCFLKSSYTSKIQIFTMEFNFSIGKFLVSRVENFFFHSRLEKKIFHPRH